jgi:hypothetical protein
MVVKLKHSEKRYILFPACRRYKPFGFSPLFLLYVELVLGWPEGDMVDGYKVADIPLLLICKSLRSTSRSAWYPLLLAQLHARQTPVYDSQLEMMCFQVLTLEVEVTKFENPIVFCVWVPK